MQRPHYWAIVLICSNDCLLHSMVFPAPVVGELYFGAENSARRDKNYEAMRALIGLGRFLAIDLINVEH